MRKFTGLGAAFVLAAIASHSTAQGPPARRGTTAPPKSPPAQLDLSQVAGFSSQPLPMKLPGDDKAGEKGFPTDVLIPSQDFADPNRPPRPDIVAPLGQKIVLRPHGIPEKRVIPANIVIDRPDLFVPVAANKGLPYDLRPGGAIHLQGKRLGKTYVRFIDPDAKPTDKPALVLIQIVPDVDYLNRLVRSRFPLANLTVTAAGDDFLFVDGHVESAADVEAVEDLLKYFYPKVVNTIRVAGVQQVQLEVVIARVDRTMARQLGVNLLVNDRQRFFGSQVGSLINAPQVTLPTAGAAVFAPLGPMAAPLSNPSTTFFGVTSQSQALFGFIEALRQQNVAKILANPTLVTFSGRQADFLVGGEQPIPIAGSITAPTVGFKAFGTRLTFLPTVLGGGKIRIDVVPEVSTTNFANSATVGGLQVPQFIVQRLHATVELQSGQTLCLGGLLQSQVESQTQKVPFLGELPGVGALFRRVRHQTVESELLVLVTPRLFNPLDACEAPKVLPGQQTVAPTDAQLFLHGAIESAPPDGTGCVPPTPILGDLMGQATVPAVVAVRGGSYQALVDAVSPTPAVAPQPSAALTMPRPVGK